MDTILKVDAKDVELRQPKSSDVEKLFEMFEKEGWCVGKEEIRCWIKGFPEIFLIAEYKGECIGCINVQNLSPKHAYIGNYVVDERYRAQGIGKRLWSQSVARAQNRGLILTSEPFNYDMYAKSGFKVDQPACINRVVGVKLKKVHKKDLGLVILDNQALNRMDDTLEKIIEYDTSVTSLERQNYVKAWVMDDSTYCFIAKKNNVIVGYCVACLYKDFMYRLGPLFADSMDIAQNLIYELQNTVSDKFTFTLDADPGDSKIDQLLENRLDKSVTNIEINFIYTDTDVPLDNNRTFFYSQLTLTRT